jgi:ABC-type uncharacterized transport system fused permease/ATPase subunit
MFSLSKLKNKITSFISTNKFTKAVAPFFTKKNLVEKIAVGAAFIGMHTVEFYLIKHFAKPEDSNSNANMSSYAALGSVLITATIVSLRTSITNRLTMSLDTAIKLDISKRWLSNNSSTGLKLLQSTALESYDFYTISIPKKPNIETLKKTYQDKIPLLIQDPDRNIWVFGKGQNDETKLTLLPKKTYLKLNFSKSVTKQAEATSWLEVYQDIAFNKAHITSNSYLNIQDTMFMNIHNFSYNTAFLAINTPSNLISLGTTFYITRNVINNNYIIAFSSFFLGIAALIMHQLGEKQSQTYNKMHEVGGKLGSRFMHIDNNTNEIVALRTEQQELSSLTKGYNEKTTYYNKIFIIDTLADITSNYAFGGFPLLFKLFAPSFLTVEQFSNATYMDVLTINLANIMSYFKDAIKAYTQVYPKMRTELDRINKLQLAFKMWEDFKNHHQPSYFTLHYSSGSFSIRNLSVAIPELNSNNHLNPFTKENIAKVFQNEKTLLLRNANLSFQPGKTYLLSGESGLGKSTVLKSILGLYHNAKGEVYFPCPINEIYFVSQNPIFPIDCTLLEAITYSLPNHNKIDLAKLIRYMEILGLSKLIPLLEVTKQSWASLSRGEQQRLSLLHPLLNHPKPVVLIMDEPTASINREMRKVIQALIKDELKNTIIIYVDHDPLQADSKIAIGMDTKVSKEFAESSIANELGDNEDIDVLDDKSDIPSSESAKLSKKLASVQNKFVGDKYVELRNVGAPATMPPQKYKLLTPQQIKERRSHYVTLPGFSIRETITIDEKSKKLIPSPNGK